MSSRRTGNDSKPWTDDELSDAMGEVADVRKSLALVDEDLATAETVETEADFRENVKAAIKSLRDAAKELEGLL